MASTPFILEAEELSRVLTEADETAGFLEYSTRTGGSFLEDDQTIIELPFESRAGKQAKATGFFGGETGTYTVEVIYLDSNRGESASTLTIGGNAPLTWAFDQIPEDGDAPLLREIVTQEFSDPIVINNNDAIELIGTSATTRGTRAQDLARIDKFIFTPVLSEFGLDTASLSLEEGDSEEIVIQRSNGIAGTAEVELSLTNGTNVTDGDYLISVDGTPLAAGNNTITFDSDEASKTITVVATDDTLEEVDEVVTLSLAPVDGESTIINAQSSFELTILANDQSVATPTPTPVTPSPTPTPVTPSPTPTPITPAPTTSTPTPTPITSTPTPTPTITPSPSPIPTVVSPETINGATNRADRLRGTQSNDTIEALNGNDIVIVGRGNDIVKGGNGRDLISGGSGDDDLEGGNGRDILNGGRGADDMNGDNGADILNGGQGNDTLSGGQRSDRISGGTGDDSLFGNGGRDFLRGGAGSDTLQGGAGSDTLHGGTDSDTFVLELVSGVDRILDFDVSTDQLQLPDGVTFEDLEIKAMGGDTLIKANNTKIAMLENVDADLLISDGVFS